MYTFIGIWGDARTTLDQTREDEASAIRYACWACEDWGKVEVYRDGVLVGLAKGVSTGRPIWVSL